MTNKNINKVGFTLVEIMVAVSVFVIVAFMVTATLLLIMDASRRANQARTVVDNTNFALESMSQKIKFGSNYTFVEKHGSTGTEAYKTFCFLDQRTAQVVKYSLSGGKILMTEGSSNPVAITSDEVKIDFLSFYKHIKVDDTKRGSLMIMIKASGANKVRGDTQVILQTSINQVESGSVGVPLDCN